MVFRTQTPLYRTNGIWEQALLECEWIKPIQREKQSGETNRDNPAHTEAWRPVQTPKVSFGRSHIAFLTFANLQSASVTFNSNSSPGQCRVFSDFKTKGEASILKRAIPFLPVPGPGPGPSHYCTSSNMHWRLSKQHRRKSAVRVTCLPEKQHKSMEDHPHRRMRPWCDIIIKISDDIFSKWLQELMHSTFLHSAQSTFVPLEESVWCGPSLPAASISCHLFLTPTLHSLAILDFSLFL